MTAPVSHPVMQQEETNRSQCMQITSYHALANATRYSHLLCFDLLYFLIIKICVQVTSMGHNTHRHTLGSKLEKSQTGRVKEHVLSHGSYANANHITTLLFQST